ncbi:branched-chain amino acid ABC transporter permease [Aeromicrobium phragmitis]|uniref:Branched-chain amino acid ABC transporter permease n=1 Tax=Aeromicrobium phragmitis TaxID=2478914 RepID=A0A3L8PRT8_9ACTN|nr:branched-chain amino acid ABC transporter permease [Aeromicrobium phragmitis]RLV57098.1 branched-chain amino acid ABC transporter permease [Aeromicrobium phragmitis]
MTTQVLVRLRTPLLLCAIAGVVAVAGLAGGPTVERVAVLALISIVFVTGLSTFSANSGIMSFGHVAFMALGAYTAAFLTIPVPLKGTLFSQLPEPMSFLRELQSSFVVAVVVGGLVAAVLGLITAPGIARLSGLQSGIATLAVLMVTYNVLSSWTSVTRGSSSMIGIPQATTLWSGLGFAVAAIIVAWAYQSSRSGLQLRASREDYWASVASGVSVGRHRATAWVLSAFLCGAAGALYASFITSFNVSVFFLSTTFSFIVMVVLGGYLSLSGAVLGAVGVSLLQEVLRRFQDGQFTGGSALPAGVADLMLAALLLVVLIKFPLGLMGSGELGQRGRQQQTDEVEPQPEGASA